MDIVSVPFFKFLDVAFSKREKEWYFYDDESVDKIEDEERLQVRINYLNFQTPHAYVLFYQRVTQ